jgi:RNA polymerase sigma factor (sigma-70 family)
MATSQLSPVLGQMRRWTAAQLDADATDAELVASFLATSAEPAFAALVRRHGPLVLGVARRMLGRLQDAEDVFQATFLLLARKAGTIRRRDSVGSWLYGVAYRLARKARGRDARRRVHEKEAAAMRGQTVPSNVWQQFSEALDAALNGLPAHYRAVLLACHAEGLTQEEAARQLGLPIGTVRSRLARGRALLRKRLAARGVTVPLAGLAALGIAATTSPPVRAQLMEKTVRASLAYAAGQAVTGLLSAPAADLVKGGLSLAAVRAKAAFVLLLTFAVAATAAVGYMPRDERASEAGLSAGAPEADERPGPRRDAAGDPLPHGTIARLGTLRYRAGFFITALAFAPDDRSVTLYGDDGHVAALEVATGRLTRTFQARDLRAGRRACLSADGRWAVFAEASRDGLIRPVALHLCDCTTGKPVRAFGEGPNRVAQFAPDGVTLAVTRLDGVVEIWNPHEGRLLRSWKADDAPGYDLFIAARFAAGGKRLITVHRGDTLRCWDAASGARLWEVGRVKAMTAWAVAPNGGLVAVDGSNYDRASQPAGKRVQSRMRLLDVATGAEVRVLVAETDKSVLGIPHWFMSAQFSADGKLLATTGQDRLVRLWDTATGKELCSWPFKPNFPGALAFAHDGRTLALADAGKTVRLLDVTTGAEVAAPAGNRSAEFRAFFTPDGRTVMTADTIDATLHWWDPVRGRLLRKQKWPARDVAISAVSSDCRTLFSWGSDQPVRTWDLASGKEIHRWPTDFGLAYPAAIVPSPDNKTLALLFQRPSVVLADAVTGKEVRRLEAHSPYPSGAIFLPDGRRLLTWGADARVRVWDLGTGREVRQIVVRDRGRPPVMRAPGVIQAPGVFFGVSLSADGRLAAVSQNGTVTLYDLATGRELRTLALAGTPVFAPDGRTLAAGDSDSGSIRLVEVASGDERQGLVGHRGRVGSVAFAPDGGRLVSAGDDTTALVWDLTGRHDAQPPTLAAGELETCWTDLAGDGTRAWQAMRKLTAGPQLAVAFLREHLHPVAAADEKTVARLVADLDAEQFAVRERATAELEKLGEAAGADMRKALDAGPSTETRRRLTALLDQVENGQWNLSRERLRALRAVEVLERIGSAETRRVLARLAVGAAGARLTREANESLRRLALSSRGR